MDTQSLTELQLSVMQALWCLEEGSVAEVRSALQEDGRDLAPTTVATLLHRLAEQGWVQHRTEGRRLLYRAKVARSDAAKGALRQVISAFFSGKPSILAAHLLDSEDVSAEELREMRRLLAKRKQ